MEQIWSRRHFNIEELFQVPSAHSASPHLTLCRPCHLFHCLSFPLIYFSVLCTPLIYFSFCFLSSTTVWWSDKWRGHCGLRCEGGSWKMLASSLLCLQHVWGAVGGSHLLLPRWQDLLWPAPRREAKTPLLCLWWGVPVWAWSPSGLKMTWMLMKPFLRENSD